jgi:hypothetical protein
MKDGIQQVIGKTISGVIVAKAQGRKSQQVFLVFNDETYFEFFGDSFTGGGGVDQGGLERVRQADLDATLEPPSVRPTERMVQ